MLKLVHLVRSLVLYNAVDNRMDDISAQLGFKNTGAMSDEINELKKRLGLRSTFEELGIDKTYSRNCSPDHGCR